tara:strand:- start:3335 stop:3793 length:459 start_codon:yes stop_codon:yes gene_type:complete
MLTFMQLLESLRSPYPWHVVRQNSLVYEVEFITSGQVRYRVTFDADGPRATAAWHVEFAVAGAPWKAQDTAPAYRITGTGDAFQIFATVIAILRGFIKLHTPQEIYFTGFSDEPSRLKLYTHLVGMTKSELPGYQGSTQSSSLGRIFRISRV